MQQLSSLRSYRNCLSRNQRLNSHYECVLTEIEARNKIDLSDETIKCLCELNWVMVVITDPVVIDYQVGIVAFLIYLPITII